MYFFKSMLQDGDNGTWSSKRIITFLAFIFCSIAFFANMFFGYDVKQYMFEGMMMVAIAGLGVTVTEKFATNRSYSSKTYGGKPLPKQEDREL
ncbi:hypothetical protein EB118_12940 [bacterium]|nr:hypothetical protein [bacterium]